MTPSPGPTTSSLPPSTSAAPSSTAITPAPSLPPTHQAQPAPPSPAVDPEDLNKWLYKDPQGEIQGLFPAKQQTNDNIKEPQPPRLQTVFRLKY